MDLPQDIITVIFILLDYSTLFLINRVTSKFNKFCSKYLISILKVKLSQDDRVAKFNMNEFNLFELWHIYKLYSPIDISNGHNHSLILTSNNEVYSFYHSVNSLDINNIKHVSAGMNNSAFLTYDGQIYVCGNNHHGQLGLGDNNDRQTPTLLQDFIDISQVSLGYDHMVFVCNNGESYSCGYNDSGQLGLANSVTQNTPVLLADNIIAVSTGMYHSLILSTIGKVYSFGWNRYGQLGLGDTNDRMTPILIGNLLQTIVSISSTMTHSLILTDRGKVYSFGCNGRGQLGLNDVINRNIPTLIESLDTLFIIQISAKFTSLVLSSNGGIYSFGINKGDHDYVDNECIFFGYDTNSCPYPNDFQPNYVIRQKISDQLLPNLLPLSINVAKLAAGINYSLILTTDSKIFSFSKFSSDVSKVGEVGYKYYQLSNIKL